MGIDTSASVWFGYPTVDDFMFVTDDLEGDEHVEVVFGGYYDTFQPGLAVRGTVTVAYECESRAVRLVDVTPEQVAALKAVAEREGFPTEGKEPQWYFAAHMS